MRILLIYPPTSALRGESVGAVPPLGLAYLASVVEKQGHTVKILDALLEGYDQRTLEKGGHSETVGLSWREIERRLSNFQPDIVGVTSMFWYMNQSLHKVAELAKNYDKNVPVVVGGAHPSLFARNILADINIDFVVIGEGEITFAELAHNLKEGKGYYDVKGIAYRKNGNVILNPPRDTIRNLDDLPFPARHLLSLTGYCSKHVIHGHTRPKTRAYTSMITSRGCPFQCTFCTVPLIWGRKWRARSPDMIVAEIQHLTDTHGIREVHFEDDNISLDATRMRRICELLLEKGVNVNWTTPNGIAARTLDERLVSLMARSGCYRLNIGVESADPAVLRQIRKPVDLRQVTNVIHWCRKYGIETCGFFMIGFPSDSVETIGKTLSFAVASELDYANFNILVPFPGTEIHAELVGRELISKEDELDRYRVQGFTTLRTDNLSARELVELQRELTKAFARNRLRKDPIRVFLRRLRYLNSIEDLGIFADSIFRSIARH